MAYYTGVVDRGGLGYGIWFPDLPGCTSGGKDLQDLLAMATESVALWTDAQLDAGRQVPAPRDITSLLADPHVIEAQREDDAFFLLVPGPADRPA